MTKSDLKRNIYMFHVNVSKNDRFASYDFCYDYFQSNKGTLATDMAQSCFRLWGYLASWGMLRGSSELLQRSPASLEELIKYFDSIAGEPIWDMDVPDYGDPAKAKQIVDVYNKIHETLEKIIKHPTTTLVTKIMLATLGVIPAFDTYFTATFRKDYDRGGYEEVRSNFNKFDDSALRCLYDFYTTNQAELDAIKINVLDFGGNMTDRVYKIAKLIDMYGFSKGAVGEELLPGKFSVAKNRQVQFSRGNLQYLPIEDLWCFAKYQTDFIGEKNEDISIEGEITCSGWVDLFQFDSNIAQNIKDTEGTTPWRMLSHSEWDYLLNKRKNAKNLIAHAVMGNVNCIVLLPDDWNLMNDQSIKTRYLYPMYSGSYDENKFKAAKIFEDWKKKGVVFLPMAGYAVQNNIPTRWYSDCYAYWSSTKCNNELVSKKDYEIRFRNRDPFRDEGENLFSGEVMALQLTIDEKLDKIKLQHPFKTELLSVRLVKDC